MSNWLQKIIPAADKKGSTSESAQNRANLPANPLSPLPRTAQNLPNATIIYGIGAGLLLVASFSLLIGRQWFSAFVVFALALCLMGFALHLLKHQD